MQAIVVNQNSNGIEVVDKPIPSIHHGQALIRIQYCGVCHTDIHVAHGDFGKVPGRILGHEGIGIVEQIASDVTALKVGDRVAIPWFYQGCGHCEYCTTGRETLCRSVKNAGFTVDGAMADYCVVPADYAVVVPDKLDGPKATSLTCAGVTTYTSLKHAHVRPGQWVAIMGAGGLGNLAVQYAKNVFNAHVVAIDINDDKLALAKKLGADFVVNSLHDKDAAKTIIEKTGGCHATVITAVAKPAFNLAVNCLRAGGIAVVNGLPNETMDLSIVKTVLDGITVSGSLVGTRNDLKEALQFGAEGKVNPVVTLRAVNDAPAIFAAMEQGKVTGRMVLDFTHQTK